MRLCDACSFLKQSALNLMLWWLGVLLLVPAGVLGVLAILGTGVAGLFGWKSLDRVCASVLDFISKTLDWCFPK